MPIGLGLGVAIAGGVAATGAIAGSMIQGNAIKGAAQTSATPADRSLEEQRRQFDATTAQQQKNYDEAVVRETEARNASTGAASDALASNTNLNKPFITTGTDSLRRLAGLYGLDSVDENGNFSAGSAAPNIDPNATFYQTPDYQFQLSQGVKGVDAGAAARGMLDSGATRKAEISYAGNLASSQFGSYAARLAALAGVGQTASGNQQNANTNYASQVGNAAFNAANGSNSAGTNAANQISGANNNYANNVTDINTNNANNQANAQLAGANNTVSTLNSVIGQATQALGKNPFASSYQGGGAQTFAPGATGAPRSLVPSSYDVGNGVLY